MKKNYAALLLCFVTMQQLVAQTTDKKTIFTFTITDYIVAASDSVSIVQVELPLNSAVTMELKQAGLMRRNYNNDNNDTAVLASGRCQLIKGNYYYFGMRRDKNAAPLQANDLLYTMVYYPAAFQGRIYNLIKNGIYLDRVTEGSFYNFTTAVTMDEKKENSLIDSLVDDIHYTGSEMQKQNNGQDQDIKGGSFDGKKLFAAMQQITAADVKDFLDYVIVRPRKYAGNHWKISETFATWMVSNTPKVVK
ncbi:hypothetical protein [Ferruginibacter sp.]